MIGGGNIFFSKVTPMTTPKAELQRKWHALEDNIHSIELLLSNESTITDVLTITEKINQLNSNLQLLTIETLNNILDLPNNFNICPVCQTKMDVLANQIICENPTCSINDYEPHTSVDP